MKKGNGAMVLSDSSVAEGHERPAVAGLEIDRSPSAIAEASRDFGHLIAGRAEGVVRPRTLDDVVAAVRHALATGVTLTPCGKRASCGGQSLPNGGLSLDMTTLNGVGPIDVEAGTIECDAGATLRAVSEATLRHDMVPRILSFNLDLTVGGVLSAGGFGANCHRFGPMIANVPMVDVVTGAGERIHCSRESERPLFDAVLGGLGRCGVIARATLALRRIRPRVRLWNLLYHRHQDWLDAQELLARSDRVDYMQGFFWAGPQVLRPAGDGFLPEPQWFFGLSIGCEHDGEGPDEARVLAGLEPTAVLTVDDADTREFIDLYRDRFVQMRRSGAWERRHPWVDCLLSPAMVRENLPRILAMLPRAAGDGHRLAWFPTRALPGLFSVPDGEWAIAIAILPVAIEESVYEQTQAALDELRRMLWGLGGKAYLIGWFGPMDDSEWRRHYGPRYDAWRAAKKTYDPQGVLHSMAFGA